MNVTILGGGMAGLLAAYAFRDLKPLLLEAAPNTGGNYAAGGLKYIRHTPAMEKLLADIQLPWTPHTPVGVLHIAGAYHRHPAWLADQHRLQRTAIQETHWIRTRGHLDGFRGDCMNDPLGNGGDVAMKCDHTELLGRLAALNLWDGVNIRCNTKISGLDERSVQLSDGTQLAHDLLILTIPLAAIASLAPWAGLPRAVARPLTILDVKGESALAPTWDYMYTPMENYITRVTWPEPGKFQLELPGIPFNTDGMPLRLIGGPFMQVAEEASRILAPYDKGIECTGGRVIPGHLGPLPVQLEWPSVWRPLGRFTQWEPRATAERVLDTAMEIRASLQ